MKFIDSSIEDYCISKSNRPSNICDELAEQTRKVEDLPQMLIGQMEGSFLGFLIRSLGVQTILEIGTFTGYSALAMAEQLPEGGVVHTLDVDKKDYTREFWDRSPHGAKIKFHQGPALDSIPTIGGSFDLVFIDADKVNYSNYLTMTLERLSQNGVIVIDNCLWSGNVLKDNEELKDDASTMAIKSVNDLIASRDDLYGSLLPVRDGMFLIKKIS